MKKFFNSTFILLLLLVLSITLCSCGANSASVEEIEIDDNTLEKEYDEDQLASSMLKPDTAIDAKIIRTFSIRGETKDFDSAIDAITKQLSSVNGYVEQSNITGGQTLSSGRKIEKRATYVLRIPADKVDSFLENTKGSLNITSSSESSTDVTLDYYDIESRLKTLESKKIALDAMLEEAKTIDEILLIQDNLYQVISDIESYQSKLNTYDSKVNYSTVNLEIVEVVEYTELEKEEAAFGKRIGQAFKNSWKNFGKFLQGLAVFLVAAFPTLLVLAAITFLVIFIIRKSKKKNKNDKNKS